MSGSITVKDLSPDQRVVFDAIMGWARNPGSRSLLTMGGYGGTGKSTLVSLVAEQVELPAFCAYTGKAASVLRRKLRDAGLATIGAQPRKNGQQSLDERPFCGTIHSLIYRPCSCREPQVVKILKPCPAKDCDAETRWARAIPIASSESVCAVGHKGLVKDEKAFEALKPKEILIRGPKNADGSCTHCGDKGWLRRDVLDRNYALIIVDEASMVDDTMLRDLRSYQVPILAVGDHGQLPPVGGSGSLMRSPDLRLEKIHRQAEGNPIIALSKIIRETGRIPDNMPNSEAVRFGRIRDVERIIEERYEGASAARLLEMGIACYTNRRRTGLNLAVRRVRGTARYGRELPMAGEHVVCLRNMKGEGGRPPVSNGMRGVLTTDARPKLIKDPHGQFKDERGEAARESEVHIVGSIEFPEDEIEAQRYEMLRTQFGREKTYQSPEELARETGFHSFAAAGSLFDFGFAMTGHKFQGSQVDDLLAVIERPGPVDNDSWARWQYTICTRAARKLWILK